jgi:hypothetical protein
MESPPVGMSSIALQFTHEQLDLYQAQGSADQSIVFCIEDSGTSGDKYETGGINHAHPDHCLSAVSPDGL